MKELLNSLAVVDYCNLFNRVVESVENQLCKENEKLDKLFMQIHEYDEQLITILDTTSLDRLDRVMSKLCNKILPPAFRTFVYKSCETSFNQLNTVLLDQLTNVTCCMVIMSHMPKLWQYIINNEEMAIMKSIIGPKAIPLYCSVRAANILG